MEVNDKVLATMVEGVRAVHGKLTAGGNSLQKNYFGPSFFDVGDPSLTIANGLKACDLLAQDVAERAARLAKDHETAASELAVTQEELRKSNERYAKLLAGQAPCRKCMGFGEEEDGSKCKTCDGAAFAAGHAA